MRYIVISFDLVKRIATVEVDEKDVSYEVTNEYLRIPDFLEESVDVYERRSIRGRFQYFEYLVDTNVSVTLLAIKEALHVQSNAVDEALLAASRYRRKVRRRLIGDNDTNGSTATASSTD